MQFVKDTLPLFLENIMKRERAVKLLREILKILREQAPLGSLPENFLF